MKKENKTLKKGILRTISWKLIILHLIQLSPLVQLANGGGPGQPEMQSFVASSTDNTVDPFTGDFSYNIPLLDIDGYPINIGYKSGIQMSQEASWVGLGWTLNPGVVSRTMRGLPDDFSGDPITKEMNMKPNVTVGVEGSLGLAIVGFDTDDQGNMIEEVGSETGASTNLEFGIGISHNTYTGIGISRSINLGLSSVEQNKTQFTGNLGINSSSANGLTVTANAGARKTLSSKLKLNEKNFTSTTTSLTSNLGTSFNSRAGLQQVSFGISYERQKKKTHWYGATVTGVSQSLLNAGASWDFGTPTYTPSFDLPMKNFSASGKFKFGAEPGVWFHTYGKTGGFMSSQKLSTNMITRPAYGYMHSEKGQQNIQALMDFNREKDGGYSPNHAALPLANYTYDLYSFSAQGAGGSFRTFRNDVGHVFDPATESKGGGTSIGGEIGAGKVFHGGIDIAVNNSNSNSNKWTKNNKAINSLKFSSNKNGYQTFYFRDAGERAVTQNTEWLNSYGGYDAVKIPLVEKFKFDVRTEAKMKKKNGTSFNMPNQNFKKNKEVTNQSVSYLRVDQLQELSLTPNLPEISHPGHHIGELTLHQPGGQRYTYGIPAYNIKTKEVTFAVGMTRSGTPGLTPNCSTGLVNYTEGQDNSINNTRGIDNFYSSVTTPEYAHSYLLTHVLSSNYSDIDDIKGPSKNDIGEYTVFHYDKYDDDFKWRSPYNHADFNEGLKSNLSDDKASYIYGEKELWYLDSIVTKNMIAIFHKEDRKDGHGVVNEDGGISTSSNQQLLRKISLFSLPDYRENGADATPIKEVHFEYDYSLCGNHPSNDGTSSGENNANKGKLTLKKIYFTYENSYKAKFNPYEFEYGYNNPEYNPDFNPKNVDRWGTYKENESVSCDYFDKNTNAEFPYAIQDKETADKNAAAWTLTQINTPSSGKIIVDYESDTYSHVQHKKAMKMAKVVGVAKNINNANVATGVSISENQEAVTLSDDAQKNKFLLFEIDQDETNIDKYFDGITNLYFRFLMNMHKFNSSQAEAYDFVSGYAQIGSRRGITTISGKKYGYVRFLGVDMGDNPTGDYNPISKAAIQYNRLHLPKVAWGEPDIGEADFGENFFKELIRSSIASTLIQTVRGANKDRWENKRGQAFITNKSWIRLQNPSLIKYGGGARVKSIRISDEWSEMTDSDHQTMQFGKEYSYNTIHNNIEISSGVAAYEPQVGGDENPFRQPIFYDQQKTLVPDDEFYMETPFGESFFPSPVIGYSKVTVKNLDREGVTKHATGKTEFEFYTAKDFPTLVDRTIPDKERHRPVFSLLPLFKINSRDFMTVSQGFYIELNNMHGKPKGQNVYQEGINTPISSTRFVYKEQAPKYANTHRLSNLATVVNSNGDISEQEIGVTMDLVNDFRESKTTSFSGSANVNLDVDVWGVPIPLPSVWPSLSREKTQYRSASTTKVVNRFGLLDYVEVEEFGSKVKTKNLAYDENTGDLLLSEVNNNYDDKIYSLKFPAHWHYDNMGLAYKSINSEIREVNFNNSGNATISNASKLFAEGDEIYLETIIDDQNFYSHGWITSINNNQIKVVDKFGNNLNGNFNIKVLRSGRKNMASTAMATITTKENPLSGIKTNLYNKVLEASAIDFSEDWRTHCNCLSSDLNSENANPYVNGNKGNWLVKSEHNYLTQRTQANTNNNSNIREDGLYESFSPFYKLQANSNWEKDPKNWTYTSEISEFSPKGSILEVKDALNRYSANNLGYNSSAVTASGTNTQYRELGFDGFEDYNFGGCEDDHFRFELSNPNQINNRNSHTGRNSIKVTPSRSVSLTKQIDDCFLIGCDISLQIQSGQSSGSKQIKVINGEPPYNFEWDITEGNPTVTFVSQSELGVSGSDWTLKVTVSDANGCVYSDIFNGSNSTSDF